MPLELGGAPSDPRNLWPESPVTLCTGTAASRASRGSRLNGWAGLSAMMRSGGRGRRTVTSGNKHGVQLIIRVESNAVRNAGEHRAWRG